jgi:hypothetical protein
MKPTKNKVFCRDCERTKMLFETEKKANNFIEFNKEDIESEAGYAPQRSYFCIFCGGWHTTSIKESIGISKNEKLFEIYLTDKENKKGNENNKANDEEKRTKRISELEDKIKSIDSSNIEIFFTELIEFRKNEIENLSKSENLDDNKKLKELRQDLDTIYFVRKKYGFHRTTNYSDKLKEKEREEWKLWHERKGSGRE